MVPVFYGHTKSQQIVRPCIFLPSSNSHFVNTELTREIWLNAVVSPEKREEKTRLAVIKKRRSRHDRSSSKLLFRKPQVLVIIGQLCRRKQKAKTDNFIPCSAEDHQDFFVTAWSPPSLLDKVTKLQTKCVVHCNKTIKKGISCCNTEVTGSTDTVTLAWRPWGHKRVRKPSFLLRPTHHYSSQLHTDTSTLFPEAHRCTCEVNVISQSKTAVV